MLEANLTTLLNLEAAAEQPPARISLPAARRNARTRRYWHRTLVLATPVLAAGAVVAIVAGATLFASGRATSINRTGPVGPTLTALGPGFDPMRVYASFGWLPAGTSVSGGETSRTMDWVDSNGALISSLYVHQPGLCGLQEVPASSGATDLNCSDNSPTGGYPPRVTGRAPDIDGHPAYWASTSAGQFLIWTYSGRGWAVLQTLSSCSGHRSSPLPPGAVVIQPHAKDRPRCITQAELVRVARSTSVGAPVASLWFPAVLTRVPKDWQVATTSFTVQHGHLLANYVQVTAGPKAMSPNGGPPDNTPVLTVLPVSEEQAANIYCTASAGFLAGHPRPEVINGYQVLAATVPWPGHPPTQEVCAPDADGLVAFVEQTGAHPKLSAATLFSRLQFLGTDPARWTSHPVG